MYLPVQVLERGEKIELLVDKTDNLRFQVNLLGRLLRVGAAGPRGGQATLAQWLLPEGTGSRALAVCRPPPLLMPPLHMLRAVQADKFHKTGRQLRSRMWWQVCTADRLHGGRAGGCSQLPALDAGLRLLPPRGSLSLSARTFAPNSTNCLSNRGIRDSPPCLLQNMKMKLIIVLILVLIA